MARWLFDTDPDSRSVETFHEDGDGWVIEKTQIVDPIIDEATVYRNEVSDYRPFAGQEWVRFASVPKTVIEAEIKKRGMTWYRDKKAVVKWVMDRDQRVFKTHPVTRL